MQQRCWSVSTYIIVTLAFASLALGQDSGKTAGLFAGCYEVTFLSWNPPDQTIKFIPKNFELSSEVWATGGYVLFRIRTLGPEAGRLPVREALSAWEPRGTNKVWVSWSSGRGGFRGTLRKQSDGDLTGKIKEWCDCFCGWKKRMGDLRVHRITCSSD